VDSKGPSEEEIGFRYDPHDAAFASGSGTAQLRRLENVLLREVLERLYQIHPDAPRTREAADLPSDEEIEAFANLVIRLEPEVAVSFFARMAERAYGFETLSERFAAPVARRLGEFWDEDRCDFVDVAFGVERLKGFLADLSGRLEHSVNLRTPRALLISTPRDNHMLALDVLSGILKEAGWIVETQRGFDLVSNTAYVAQEWTHVVGVTMGSLEHYDAVGRTLRTLRRTSRNPQISMIVGGVNFNSDRDLAVRIGADGTAPDGPAALRLAKQLWLKQTPQTA
jgi:methylmalonyl-CoA mutase cobalamin-binding subunit